jgi:hypothetical protein
LTLRREGSGASGFLVGGSTRTGSKTLMPIRSEF